MKIFVSICSYRDPLLHHTLESLIATKSERTEVTYAVFEQVRYEDSLEVLYPQLVARPDVKYKRIDPKFSNGVGWARNVNALELTDEDFYYQIDSHMLFDKNWDRALINDYKQAMAKTGTNRIVISSNCKNFDVIDNVPHLEHNRNVATLAKFYQFGNDFKIYAHGEHVDPTEEVVPAAHIFAGNLFTHADWIENVGINPKIFFHGEEQMFALASFAAGYRLFHGRWICCYHYIGSNSHTSKQDIEPVVPLEIIEKRKLQSDIELIRYIRSLDDNVLESFRRYSGVDYINRKIEKRAISDKMLPSIPNDWEIPDRDY
jgi:hypothetical protein